MKTIAWILIGIPLLVDLTAQTTATATTPAPVSPAVPAQPPTPLSPATLAKIAAMKPIFDGKTLDGWIQAPSAPNTFSASDFRNLASFVKKLTGKSDPLSAYLSEQFDEPAKTALTSFVPSAPDTRSTTSVLARNFNRITSGASLHEESRFQNVRLRPETDALRRKNPRGQDLMRLNRMLIEDAYPDEVVQSPLISWIVKDGAMASTGGGRGVIYTQEDYAHYRLIFTMRHVSGNPDHQPCVLVFCTRPLSGERGLDALGGIQFQTPNGGHWDYRPGHNNAGDAFTRPVRTTFDNHQWHQVEILVDARSGTVRMAVAQPVGTKAITNLTFKDPAAGKTGPLAWQMHNAGLFDEFKDVRIEVDPAEDRLITVE